MPESILIVDDEPSIITALTVRLEAVGYTVHQATNGAQGLQQAETIRPDAIILDVRMPDMTGLEVCRRLKDNPELQSIPVIFLSANADRDTISESFEVHGVMFIAKPYEAKDIIRAVQSVLEPSPITPNP